MKKNPIIVNLFASPGCGKTTGMCYIFSKLKMRGYNAEIVSEYAKTKVYEESHNILNNQLYVFAKQEKQRFFLNDKVDIIITDSPLLLSLQYNQNKNDIAFINLVEDRVMKENSMNYLIERTKPYSEIGRIQTKEESNAMQHEIKCLLDKYISYDIISGDEIGYNYIIDKIEERMEK